MKKTNKKDTINLFFSAFLVTAFIVCAYFFNQFTNTLNSTAAAVVSIILFVVFGLLLFYATRVSEGKAVKRFSLVTLIVMVLPALYIIIASVATGLPFNSSFAADETTGSLKLIVCLASVALGYGIPYTFISGFEMQDETAETPQSDKPLEGGLEEALADTAETEEVTEDNTTDTTENDSKEEQKEESDDKNAESESESKD